MAKSTPEKSKSFFSTATIVLFLVSFLVYANTLSHGYVLDDKISITNNEFTKKGFGGIKDHFTNDVMTGFFGTKKNLVAGGRYRPLTHVMFSIEYALFKDNASVGHFLNALFYAFLVLALYVFLKRIFLDSDKAWLQSLPFLVTLLFAVHPIHTEVVANIKSRDEIMSLLGALLAVNALFKYLDSKELKQLIFAGIWFFLSLLSKETSVVFLGIVPLTLYFYTNKKLKDFVVAMLPFVASFVVYFGIRAAVIGVNNGTPPAELMNDPFLEATASQKWATIFYTLAVYFKLTFFPHPLTHDYYPYHIPLVNWVDPTVILAIVIHLALLVAAILGLKNRNKWAYVIWFYAISIGLFVNILFGIGTFMNERFLFVPSIASSIATVYLIQWISQYLKSKQIVLYATLAISLLYAGKTIARNAAWESDYTLATTDVKVSENSAKVNMSAGGSTIDFAKTVNDPVEKNKKLNEAIGYLKQALEIYPGYVQAHVLMGNAYYVAQQYENSATWYASALKVNPGFRDAKNNLLHVGDLSLQNNNGPAALKAYELYLDFFKNDEAVIGKIAEVYGKLLNDMQNAEKYLKMAIEINPQNAENLQKLGVVYAMTNRVDLAIDAWEKTVQLDPKNFNAWLNLGIAYTNSGNVEKGNEYIAKSNQIKAELGVK